MKILKETDLFDRSVLILGNERYCGNCREKLVSVEDQKCPFCKTDLLNAITDDVSLRLTKELFENLFPIKEGFDERSDGRGKILKVTPERDIVISAEDCVEEEQKDYIERSSETANIPKAYRGKEEKDFILKDGMINPFDIQNIVTCYYGNNNTGKTLAACIILQKMLAEGKNGYFLTVDRIISLKFGAWSGSPQEYDEVLNSDLVVIDDIFDNKKTYMKEGTPSLPLLDDFLRYRVHNMLKIVLTSNYSIDATLERWPEFHQICQLLRRGLTQVYFI